MPADRVARLVRLLAAARAVGAAEGVLAIGVAYAQRRQQFGRPIGSFQAVAHRLADAATAVDAAGLLVRKAAWTAAIEQGGDGAPDCDLRGDGTRRVRRMPPSWRRQRPIR